MGEKIVIGGPASQELAASMAKRMNARLVSPDVTEFADGETRIKFNEKVDGAKAILVQSTHPPTDKHYMQLFQMAHYLSQEGARVHAVIPYLGYARQDKQFTAGEVVSLGVVSHMLRSVGVARVTTVDIHSAEGMSLFSVPIYSVSAIPNLVQYVKKNLNLTNTVVVAPDFGSSKRTEAFATLYGAKNIQLSKQRDRTTGEVRVAEEELDVEGCDVIIVDDMISTGGTVRAATEKLKKARARKVIAACVHALLVGGAQEKLAAAGVDEIIGTNTVPSRVSKVDATEPLASYLRTLSE